MKMSDAMNALAAQKMFDTLCAALDARNWRYTKKEDAMRVVFTVQGEDLPMHFMLSVDADRQLVRLLSLLPFEFDQDKRMEGAIACCAASYDMVDGSFDYDISDGSVMFRMTQSFRDSVISEQVLHYLIECSCAMVDKYNDLFLAINAGVLSIGDFIAMG